MTPDTAPSTPATVLGAWADPLPEPVIAHVAATCAAQDSDT